MYFGEISAEMGEVQGALGAQKRDMTWVGGVREGFLGAVQFKLELELSGNELEGPKAVYSFFRV